MSETIYSQIAEIARPIVEHYRDDIAKHDRNALRSFQIGDSAVWACYASGSHLARVSFSESLSLAARIEVTQAHRRLFEAQESVFGGQIPQWYLLESTAGQRGKVTPVSVADIRELFRAKIEALENATRRAA